MQDAMHASKQVQIITRNAKCPFHTQVIILQSSQITLPSPSKSLTSFRGPILAIFIIGSFQPYSE